MRVSRRRFFTLTGGLAAATGLSTLGVSMPTPAWQAARNGLTGDANAVDKSAQVNQLLGTHANTTIYHGNPVVAPTSGLGVGTNDPAHFWAFHFDDFDYDQPFTMSGTSIGRISVPVLPVGNGADLQVSLYTDSAGSPGTLVQSVTIPAKWITSMASVAAAPGPTTSCQLVNTPGPLALPQFTELHIGAWSTVNWSAPATSATGNPNPTTVQNANYMILVGGTDSVSGKEIANVFTIPFEGGTQLGNPTPQPALPQAAYAMVVAATPDTLIAGGGVTTGSFYYDNIFAAGWDPSTGVLSSWSAQTSLPQAVWAASTAVWTNPLGQSTVYVIGGTDSGGNNLDTVYWATVQNGQITGWNTTSYPLALEYPMPFVVDDMLVVAGGGVTGGNVTNVYYANINSDGSLGTWQVGPPLFLTTLGLISGTTPNGFVHFGSNHVQSLTAGPTGVGSWSAQSDTYSAGTGQPGMFPVGTGQWQQFLANATDYNTVPVYQVPMISVPLPATGLTSGAKYHVALHQVGGDLNNYLRTQLDYDALPGNPTALYRTRGSGSWTAYASQYCIPIYVYDQTIGGQPWHTWDDAGARIGTLVYATTSDARMLGGLESVLAPDGSTVPSAWHLVYPGDASAQGYGVPGALWPPAQVVQL